MTLDDILINMRTRRNQLAADALLRQIDHILVLCDDKLVELGAGLTVTVAGDNSLSSDSLAAAAKQLLSQAEAHREEIRTIALLLPSSAFISTQVNFPGMAPGAIQAALKLQSHNVLPVFQDPLVFAVNTQTPDIAIWASQPFVDDLFTAFSEQGLLLATITPRAVALAMAEHNRSRSESEWLLIESDEQTSSMLTLKGGVVKTFRQTQTSDLADAEFADEWQKLLEDHNRADSTERNTAEQIITSLRGIESRRLIDLSAPYSIIPGAALQRTYRFSIGKWRSKLAVAAVTILLLGALPFVIQSLQLYRLESAYDSLAEQAAPAREDQRYIRNFETEWGALTEFPKQNLDQVMIALQQVIAPGYLTAIDVESGYISIEGDSQDPQNLLERLEQNELFTEVDFARATNNTRYYIDLRLATVNFPAYQEWYFPESDQR
ncbi:hypothetical protein [Pseudohongiella spirulinae]|uniref:GspL cytoplasmic actin-ATPase-like domain-containing protein n=1 Tax=Pseudohongiella spirulinae TaxID=1249552 RepID=A0A0S2K8S0_9GAMM|nr:hypothetical protein [Pseudohongiella spirulinae]ALO44742.1 hypothetical protein PS2015_44 [Pseudohongiella spirulinae]